MGQEQSGLSRGVFHQTEGRQRAKLDDIIVVNKTENKKDECDDHVQYLKNITLSNPILMQFSGGDIEYKKVPRISSVVFTEMLLRYQFHLTECAEAVSFDQNVLSKRIKEVNFFASNINKDINERYKSIDSAIAQMEKVTEIESMIEKINTNLSSVKEKFEHLNSYLPEEEKIRDFY